MIMKVMGIYSPAFTSVSVGMCCQDQSGYRMPADFDYFEYRES
jgi:xylan 1,4-beta-xylosidase